jgi:acetoin:2,6-dichlorophenolindophenol oxidoreductase subunit alpha
VSLLTAPAPYGTAGDARLVGLPSEARDARLYRRMRFIRRFEETVLALFEQGLLTGTTHACIGQEADAVAVVEHLRPGDHLFSNHRGHGHFLAWTGDALGLLTEIMGQERGVCHGIGGSQHLCAPGFKSNGVQGGIVPAATGIALAHALRGSDDLSVAFIGDGTLGEGVVYESLNLASLWRVPLLVVLEDNGWAQSTPTAVNLAGSITARFTAFDLPVVEVDSTDVLVLERAAMEAIAGCRARRGAGALVIHTYRLCHHSKNDDNRPADEVEARRALDPLVVHGRRIDAPERERIDEEVDRALDEVIAEASRT